MSLKDANRSTKQPKRVAIVITGQQNFSGEETARVLIEALGR